MARALGARVRYGAVVEDVTHYDNGVAERVKGETVRADRAVFTLPCSVTGGLFPDAKLSAEGQRVIGELTFSPVATVFWQPRKRQWLRPGSSGYRSGGGALVDGAASVHQRAADIDQLFKRWLDGTAESERVAYAIRHAETMYLGQAKEKEGG